MDFVSRDSEVTRNSGLEILKHCEEEFIPFNLPDGTQFSVDDFKIPHVIQVIGKIRDSYQMFFAALGLAASLIFSAKFAEDEGRNNLYLTAWRALSSIHHVDFGGVDNTMAILKEIDAKVPWMLADNIIQRQRTNVDK